VSTRKNPAVVDEAAEAPVDGSVEPVLDPELDQVPVEERELDASSVGDELATDGEPSAEGDDSGDKPGRTPRSRLKIVVGAAAALVLAAVAVGVAGAMGGSEAAGIPETVGDPVVVLNALNEGGVSCTGTAVSGQVATCNATVAVRIFDSPAEARTYVSDLLKDPLTSSAIGWVSHGNTVVAAPLTATPEVAAALGEGSQIH